MAQTPGLDVSLSYTPSNARTLQGRYVLHEMIGRGHLATVYRALDTTLDRAVAVKLLHPHLASDPRFVERFLEMERRIARLFHPNLVTIFDAGTTDDTCFVVMEYVAGGSLGDLLAGTQRLSTPRTITFVSQVAGALQALHDEGIVHGEIKPGNVLLDEDGDAKLVDFGIAHLATTTGVIRAESLSKSAPYLAPEQLGRGYADARSDVYALGLLTYELLAGRKPFEGETWITTATQRLERDPEPLEALRPDLPGELSGAVMQALTRDPDHRFASAEAFRQALRLAEASPPGVARLSHLLPHRGTDEPRLESRPSEPGPPAGPNPAIAMERTAVVPRLQARPRAPAIPFARRLGGLDASTRLLLIAALAASLLLLAGALALPRLIQPPRQVVAPPIVGQTLDEARRAADQAGLKLAPSEASSESAARGVVMQQDPPANSTLPSSQPLKIVVSSGPPPVKMPDLRQRRLDDARQDLAAVGLGLGKVDEREVDRQPWGTIVDQSVKPGSDLARGGTIDVTVGLAPRTSAPRLLERSIGDAQAELERRGLRLGGVQLQPASDKRAGTVVAQDPAPDTQLRQGESVALTIAVPAAPVPAKP